MVCLQCNVWNLSLICNGQYLHVYYLCCVHYIKIFLFMSVFHLCALKSVLWKFLWFFHDLKFNIFPTLIHENNKILHVFKGKKCQTSNQEKSPISFYRIYYFCKMYNFQKYFFDKFLQFGTLWLLIQYECSDML